MLSNKSLITKTLFIFLATLICTVTIPVLEKATAIIPAVPSLQISPPLSSNLVQQAKALYDTGQFAEAVKLLQQAASAFESQGDSLKQAMALSDLSLAYQKLGQWAQANTAIADSLKLLQTPQHVGTSKDKLKIQAQALNTQGSLQLALGQPEQALDTWQKAAAAYAQAGDDVGTTRSLINQAQALQSLGSYRQALDILKQANQKLHKQPDSPIKAAGLRSLGNAWRVVGDLEKSRQSLQQSLIIANQLRSHKDIGEALMSLGNVARAQQDTQAALAFYQQAADTEPSTKIESELNQLTLFLQTQQLENAKALLPHLQTAISNLPPSHQGVYARISFAQSLTRHRQSLSTDMPSRMGIAQILATAVEQAKTLTDQRAEAHALGALGELYEHNHQWSEAQALTQQALILAQSINAPDVGYRLQWQMGRLLKAQGDIKGAIAAYIESVEDLKSLRNNLAGTNPDIQFSFRDQVEPVYRQLVDLLLQSEAGSRPSQEKLVQARSAIESLQLAELDNFFQSACLEGKQVLLDQVVDKQDPTAAVIYPIILPERLAVIIKLPTQQLRYYQSDIAQGEVEALLEDLRRTLKKPQTAKEVQSKSLQVYDWLIRPAEADLAKSKIKTLVFVLDGVLRNIPMAALYDGQQYLIQKYALALTPGLQLLSPISLQQRQIKALTAGLTEAPPNFPDFAALNNVASELNQIKAEVSATEILNQKFTFKALQAQIDNSNFSVVHLATHGQFSSRADKTFILAWDGPIFVNKLDSILQTPNPSIQNAIELLVLSACQTAAGDKRAALGLAGVSIRAGARSTIASLWDVEDESTALLMSQFYQHLATNHVSKAEALRQAQLALLNNSAYYNRPFFWSPYVLVGNWL